MTRVIGVELETSRPKPPAATLVLGGVAVLMVIGGLLAAFLPQRLSTHQTEEINLPGLVRRVSVEVDAGDISLNGSVRTGATIVRTTVGRPELIAEIDDGVLLIRAHCGKSFLNCRVDQAIEVPATAAVEAHSTSGSVELRNFAASIRLSSDAGSVTAERVAGDSAYLSSSAGAVAARDLAVREGTLRSDAGSVVTAFKLPPEVVDAASDAGSVEVRLPTGNYAIDVSSRTGRAQVEGVTNDPASGRKVSAHSSAGSVRILAA